MDTDLTRLYKLVRKAPFAAAGSGTHTHTPQTFSLVTSYHGGWCMAGVCAQNTLNMLTLPLITPLSLCFSFNFPWAFQIVQQWSQNNEMFINSVDVYLSKRAVIASSQQNWLLVAETLLTHDTVNKTIHSHFNCSVFRGQAQKRHHYTFPSVQLWNTTYKVVYYYT